MRISDWSSDVCSSDLLFHCLANEREPFAILLQANIGISQQQRYLRTGITKLPRISKLRDRIIHVVQHITEIAREIAQVRQVARWRAAALQHSGQRFPLRLHRSEEHTSELQSLMRISYAVF